MTNAPIQGEALKKALENQKPGATATAQVDPVWQAQYETEKARRDLAHARAMRPGIQTSEGIMTALVVIGALATPLATLGMLFEQLSALHPAAPILASIATVLGALHVAAKAIGGYAQSRAAVKSGMRILVALLAVGLAAPAVARDRAVLLEEPQPSLLGVELPPLADYLSVGLAAGIDYRAHRGAVPVLEALGLVGVARLGKGGPVLSLGLGGGFLLPTEAAPSFSGTLGAALSLPGVAAEKAVLPSLFLGAGYDGAGKWSAKVLFLLQT